MTAPRPAASDGAPGYGLVAAVLAVDPAGLGGIVIRGPHGDARDRVVRLFSDSIGRAVRKLPPGITEDALFGGIDLAATLQAGRPVTQPGLLAQARGRTLTITSAERMSDALARRLTSVLDRGDADIVIVALDEGRDDERVPESLSDRLALHIDLSTLGRDDAALPADADAIIAARLRYRDVAVPQTIVDVLCRAALSFGIVSLRAAVMATKVARCHAALIGRPAAADEDAILAAQLVFAPRAIAMPADDVQEPPPPEPPDTSDHDDDDAATADTDTIPDDLVLAAVKAAIPPGLLAAMQDRAQAGPRQGAAGRAGQQRQAAKRGQVIGARPGDLRRGRLDLVSTIRSAAPWQTLRKANGRQGVVVMRDDVRLKRFKHRSETATVFVVDASGSSAARRLAEAKGAIELLLADCYVRRDQVALVVFRGKTAELVLAPTRSLTRAKRCLAAVPGGGGTPLAAGIDAAATLAKAIERRGVSPVVVFLTDGLANVCRDGRTGRTEAFDEALQAAWNCRAGHLRSLVVDISPRASGASRQLADTMGARYALLPQADAATISEAVRSATV